MKSELNSGIPVLIIAFNRPEKLKELLFSLRETDHQILRISLDGPRKNNEDDVIKINECLNYIRQINWTENVEVYQNEVNLKPRFSVPKAVGKVLEEFEQVIVLEDDVKVTRQALIFFEWCLNKYQNNKNIGHISGYNNAPFNHLQSLKVSHRLSIFPESYAWATWRDRWNFYEDDISQIKLLSLFKNHRNYFLNIGQLGRIAWRLERFNSKNDFISTWAYRWTFSLWENKLFCISPNFNLVSYSGQKNGTHTFTKQRWKELPPLSESKVEFVDSLEIYPRIEKWSSKNIYRDNFMDLAKLIFICVYFQMRKVFHRYLSV